jgi:hypothetical protein
MNYLGTALKTQSVAPRLTKAIAAQRERERASIEEGQAPRRDPKVERAIREYTKPFAGDELWALRRATEQDYAGGRE